MKKINKKAFTLIELIVVVAVVGILILLGMPRFIGYKDKAELARIQHDVKVMEQEIGTVLINNDDDFNKWVNNSKDFNQLIQESRLFEKEGIAKEIESIDKVYKIIPEKYKDNINTKLKGTFYANNDGKVYYEHEKPLLGIPIEPEEKEQEYSNEEIDDLVEIGYIPVANAAELAQINTSNGAELTWGAGTKWVGTYKGTLSSKYILVEDIDLGVYEEWEPIGSSEYPFTGSLDGANKSISNMTIRDGGYAGLFGVVKSENSEVEISNITLQNIDIDMNSIAGGLIGRAQSSNSSVNVYNIRVSESKVLAGAMAGGIIGQNESVLNKFEHLSFDGNIHAGYTAGGIIGYDQDKGEQLSSLSNLASYGNISSERNAGGIIGDSMRASNTLIENVKVNSNIQSSSFSGGVLGGAYSRGVNRVSIRNADVDGKVKGGNDTGGLIGSAMGLMENIENITINASVESSDEDNNSPSASSAGGLIGSYLAGNQEIVHGSIKNIKINAPVKSKGHVGGLIGTNTTVIEQIEDISISGKISSLPNEDKSGYSYAGGLIGENVAGERNSDGRFWKLNRITITGDIYSEGSSGGLYGNNTTDTKEMRNIDISSSIQGKNSGGLFGRRLTASKINFDMIIDNVLLSSKISKNETSGSLGRLIGLYAIYHDEGANDIPIEKITFSGDIVDIPDLIGEVEKVTP